MIKTSNGDTPFSLTYGIEAVISVEIGLPSIRCAEVNQDENDEGWYETDIQEKKQKESQNQARNGKDKVEGDQSCLLPKKPSFPPQKPRYNLDVFPYFPPAKPLDTLAKIISSTLLFPPSCIKSMLAIPHLSQVSSMAEIDSKEAQKKSMAGIRALKSLTREAQERRAEDLALSINRRLCEPKQMECSVEVFIFL
ncbi:hypothetical protein Tco_1127187 [Tanacetum coccineum]